MALDLLHQPAIGILGVFAAAAVLFDPPYLRKPGRVDAPGLILKLAEQGIKAFSVGPDAIRMVTHKDVDRTGILRTLEVLRTILA